MLKVKSSETPFSFADLTAALPDVLQFMRLLWAVVHGLERTSKRMTLHVGVTGPQRLVLRLVGLFPGLAAGDLAAMLHVHPSTLTGVLQRLAADGLLHRVEDPRDRRRAVLRLTRRGVRINATLSGTVESAIDAALNDVSQAERRATMRVLKRLARSLDPDSAPRPRGGAPPVSRNAVSEPSRRRGMNERRRPNDPGAAGRRSA